MSNWRRQKPRNNNHHHHHSKPPLANCKLSVPAWEKDFCAVIGSVPWWKVLDAKRFMYLYDRVVQWDDSAGEDAFKNAKYRFYAEIHGFPCDLSLPDPDVYIDDVDWDAEVDTELFLDLERGGGSEPIREEEEHVVILDALVLSGQYSGSGWGTGWGDAEGINEEGKPENSWDDQAKTGTWDHKNDNNKKSFKTESWDQKEDSWGRKEKTEFWDHKNNNIKNSFKTESWDHQKNGNSLNRKNGETREWRKRGEVARGGDRVEDCRWMNGRGRSRGGFQQQQQSNGWGWTETF